MDKSATQRSRELLRKLRAIMAMDADAEARLQETVNSIAEAMHTDVCSVYLMRPDKRLELFATRGLSADAVHKTKLRIGQGLIGDIAANARPLSTANAESHPSFAYRPETGEDAFTSLMGVPILRGGKVVGVVAVQNALERTFEEEEIEALETVAMVLAELVSTDGLFARKDAREETKTDASLSFEVAGLADGVAIGHAVLHEPRITVTNIVSDDPELEAERLRLALAELRDGIDRMLERGDVSLSGEHREVLEAYRMFAHDRGWTQKMMEAVHSGLTAEAAVEKVQAENRARLQHQSDAYLRERLHDLDDLAHRLLRHLAGETGSAASADLPDDAVIFARTMGPAELLDYDRTKLRGVVVAEGSPTSHVAIIARALDVPMISRAAEAVETIEPGEPVIVDADSGHLHIRPSDDVIEAYRETLRALDERKVDYLAHRDEPAITQDGTRIKLNMNAGLLLDLASLEATGADGIGLFRTELQFMISSRLPKLQEQVDLYSEVLDAAGEKPVIFRTIDVGGDKVLPYLTAGREENPALGWRAIRVSLDRPALLKIQVRALLEAAAGRKLNIMFPMIADVSEFKAAREIVDSEVARRDKKGLPQPRELNVGTMLEVPSLAWQLNVLLPLVDFISVGSNDLMQFFFASDRGNPLLADRYDLLSPSVLSLLNFLVRAAHAHDVPLSLCGEMAGRPLEAMALIGIGFRRISMPAAAIPPVKEMIRSVDLNELEAFMITLLDMPDHSVRGNLETFAKDHGIVI